MARTTSAPARIEIHGNVENGNIVVGDNNFVVNTNHGTIIYQQAKPQVRLRDFAPQPPRAPRGFINRTAELGQLEAWIAANEMALVHGEDGMGKSSLLRQAANSAAGRGRANGVILLESDNADSPVLGPDDVIQRAFDALFESNPPLKVDANTARTYLSNTSPLLLLDEVPLSPALQRSLPDLFPNGAMLFTSDVEFGREDFLRMPVGALPREAAVRLFAEKSGIQINEQNADGFDSVCALLEDVSLAVVITGNVTREARLTLEDTLVDLREIGQKLEPGLERALAFAINHLTPEERDILSTAALTPGISMTAKWLEAAFGSEEAGRFVERLKALGLLVTNSPRLRVPPGIRLPMRSYASVDEDRVLRSLAEFLLAAAERAPQDWQFFADELGNLFGALSWAVRTKSWRVALRLARVVEPYLTLRGLWDAWRDALDLLLEAARQTGDRAAEAFALHQSGVREAGVGLRQKALALLRQALEIRRAIGDTIGVVYTQHNIDILIGPPPPPRSRDGQPQPQPPRPAPTVATIMLIGGAVGLMALIGLGLLGIFLAPRLFPGPTPTVEISIIPMDTIPAPPTSTFTPIPTTTDRPTQTPSATPTPSPTPIGGTGQIAFTSADTGREGAYLLYTMGIADTELRAVLQDYIPVSDPAWSPDGKSLAFASRYTQNGSSQIFIVNADGSDLRLLTDGDSNNYHPTWSPDGLRLAFRRNTSEFGTDLFVINVDGSEFNPLTFSDGVGTYDYPEWSPDGTRIAYQAYAGKDMELFVMNTDGTGQTQLTVGEDGTWNIQPSWSPDSRQIVFTSYHPGASTIDVVFQWDLAVMNADGTKMRLLTQDAFVDISPDWSPDGRMIAYSSSESERSFQIFMIPLNGAERTQLTFTSGDSIDADWWPVYGGNGN
ncbi:MAG: hypothetical protein AB1649_02565 [Chloroflexota bacterium]